MLSKFIPKEKKFFEFFNQAATKIVEAAEEFRALVNDLPAVNQHAQKIYNYEREGDVIAAAAYQLLHKTFITPFDRHDVHGLTTILDDVLDSINRLAQRFVIYHFKSLPAEISELTNITIEIAKKTQEIVAKLHTLKNEEIVVALCLKIDAIENEGEVVMLKGIDKLLESEQDFRQVLKLKEVFEEIKEIINSCQDTANLVKSIVLEYA